MRRPWIKLEVATPDKPEICTLAQRLRLDADAVVGKLVRFWSWVAQNRVAGGDLGITLDFVDRLVGRRGFGQAMVEVRWLALDAQERLSIPNFERHNSDQARTRALTKQRVAKHRAIKLAEPVKPAAVKRGRPKAKAAAAQVAQSAAPEPAVAVVPPADSAPAVAVKGETPSHWLDQPMLF